MTEINAFDPTSYPAACAELLDGDRLCDLGPGSPNSSRRNELEALDAKAMFGTKSVVNTSMVDACRAGLWLLHDFLGPSHRISQGIPTATGSYWHGIMHRREPDYSNAKYWFRRVGEHPIFETLNARSREIADLADATGSAGFLRSQTNWDAFAFIDLCDEVAHGQADSENLCREIARAEWEILFAYCYQKAIGR